MRRIDQIKNRQKIIWWVLVALLITGSISVFTKQQEPSQTVTIQSLLTIRDSMQIADPVHWKATAVLGLLELVRQRQAITALMQKDSLTPKDHLMLKQMDQQLNTLLHESN